MVSLLFFFLHILLIYNIRAAIKVAIVHPLPKSKVCLLIQNLAQQELLSEANN